MKKDKKCSMNNLFDKTPTYYIINQCNVSLNRNDVKLKQYAHIVNRYKQCPISSVNVERHTCIFITIKYILSDNRHNFTNTNL